MNGSLFLRRRAVLLLVTVWSPSLNAAPAKLPSDLQLIQDSGTNFVTLRPDALRSSELYQSFPAEFREPMEEYQFGLLVLQRRPGSALEEIERLSFLAFLSNDDRVAIVRTTEPYDRDLLRKSLIPRFLERTHRGKTIYSLNAQKGTAFCPIDPSVYVVGPNDAVRRLLDVVARPSTPALKDALALALRGDHLVVGVRPASLLPLLPSEQPKALGGLLQAKSLAWTLHFDDKVTVRCQLEYTDEKLARTGAAAGSTLLTMLGEGLPDWVARTHNTTPREMPHLFAFAKQIQDGFESATVQAKGKRVEGKTTVKIRRGSIEKALADLRKLPLRLTSQGNLKQLAVALHNYHDVHGAFPPAAITNKAGKPLLSWRVAILPYIEEGKLYKRFKLDEPWDSKHNKKLLAEMPRIYAPVRGEPKISHATHYRVFSGPGSAFDPKLAKPGVPSLGKSIRGFPDGLSNTFLVVEAKAIVPWTKPEPLLFDPKKPVPPLGGLFPTGFNAALADGAVIYFQDTTDAKTLRLLIDSGDGKDPRWKRFTKRSQ